MQVCLPDNAENAPITAMKRSFFMQPESFSKTQQITSLTSLQVRELITPTSRSIQYVDGSISKHFAQSLSAEQASNSRLALSNVDEKASFRKRLKLLGFVPPPSVKFANTCAPTYAHQGEHKRYSSKG